MRKTKLIFSVFAFVFHLYCIIYHANFDILLFSIIMFDFTCLYILFKIGKQKGICVSILSAGVFFIIYEVIVIFSYQTWKNELYFSNFYLLYVLIFLNILVWIPVYPKLCSKKFHNLILSIIIILSSFFGMMFFLSALGFITGVLSGKLY